MLSTQYESTEQSKFDMVLCSSNRLHHTERTLKYLRALSQQGPNEGNDLQSLAQTHFVSQYCSKSVCWQAVLLAT